MTVLVYGREVQLVVEEECEQMMPNIKLVILLLIVGAPIVILPTAVLVVCPAILVPMSIDGRGKGDRVIGTIFGAAVSG